MLSQVLCHTCWNVQTPHCSSFAAGAGPLPGSFVSLITLGAKSTLLQPRACPALWPHPLPAHAPALCPPTCFSGRWPCCSLLPWSPGLHLRSVQMLRPRGRSPGWLASFSSSHPGGHRAGLFLPDGTAGLTQAGLGMLPSTTAPRVPYANAWPIIAAQ